eukprot:TRINITY_DN6036_c0_g1_i1.p1 TRINITY_DN6036_c0_g1~~TRINITY_DN6036_c0_g1_i1.p1  ORF type:complete len:332 (+),score=133.19 TRINITY_DN6036_c0_g1_i1:116-1111(+)
MEKRKKGMKEEILKSLFRDHELAMKDEESTIKRKRSLIFISTAKCVSKKRRVAVRKISSRKAIGDLNAADSNSENSIHISSDDSNSVVNSDPILINSHGSSPIRSKITDLEKKKRALKRFRPLEYTNEGRRMEIQARSINNPSHSSLNPTNSDSIYGSIPQLESVVRSDERMKPFNGNFNVEIKREEESNENEEGGVLDDVFSASNSLRTIEEWVGLNENSQDGSSEVEVMNSEGFSSFNVSIEELIDNINHTESNDSLLTSKDTTGQPETEEIAKSKTTPRRRRKATKKKNSNSPNKREKEAEDPEWIPSNAESPLPSQRRMSLRSAKKK